jgi:catechol 2,3-dioxygenase-like lactoylglutathione lyase family enzyme
VIFAIRKTGRVALQRMDNVGIVVESLDAAISFFAELGLELEGRAMIEGDWSGRVTGLRDQRVEIAMMRMPDGHGRIELSRFLAPPVVADHRNAPVNALGYLRVMFAVDDLDDTLARLRKHGAQLSTKWFGTKTCIGSATSEAPRAFSPGWPSESADARHALRRHSRTGPGDVALPERVQSGDDGRCLWQVSRFAQERTHRGSER